MTHLDRAEQPVGVLAAMEEELAILRGQLTDPVSAVHGGIPFYSGRIGGHSVVLAQCGIGKVNAAMATTLMQQLFSPRAILNTGSAGGLSPVLKVGDIVLGDRVCHHDVDVTVFGYDYGQVPKEPLMFVADQEVLSAATRAAKELQSIHVHNGLIASGDVFLGEGGARQAVINRFPDILAVEMESAAIAQVCHHFGVPSLIIRSVSDLAGDDAKISFDEFLKLAADNSAQLVVGTLRELGRV